MPRKSKLLLALNAYRGRHYELERQKKSQKQAIKRKESNPDFHRRDVKGGSNIKGRSISDKIPQSEVESEEWEGNEKESKMVNIDDFSGIDDSDIESVSESEGSSNQEQSRSQRRLTKSTVNISGPGDEEGIPMSDVEDLSQSEIFDLIAHQRLTINNTTALSKAQRSIALSIPDLPFSEYQTVLSVDEILIPDINDDLNRELAFYKQSLDAVEKARILLKKEDMPFSRPTDYFAEMVKSDEHMGKIKQKMTEEAANKKAAADARKQRDLKKFGKQVQIAKLQERDKTKRETLDKINLLKRKRQATNNTAAAQEGDLFDIALEDATKPNRPATTTRNMSDEQIHGKRQKKDHKFGFGGKKRFAKSGDATSSADLQRFSSKKMKHQKISTQRLGKSRRAKKS